MTTARLNSSDQSTPPRPPWHPPFWLLLMAALGAAVLGHLLAASIHALLQLKFDPNPHASALLYLVDGAFSLVGVLLFIWGATREHARAKRLVLLTLGIGLGSHSVGISIHSVLGRLEAPPVVVILLGLPSMILLLVLLQRHEEQDAPVQVYRHKVRT